MSFAIYIGRMWFKVFIITRLNEQALIFFMLSFNVQPWFNNLQNRSKYEAWLMIDTECTLLHKIVGNNGRQCSKQLE